MAQADGTIFIDTHIETGKVKAGSKEIESAVRRMAGRVDDLGNSVKASVEKSVAALTRQNVLYAQQARKVYELQKAVKEYEKQEIPTEEYSALSQVLDDSQKKLTRLLEVQERFEASGGDKNSQVYKNRKLQIDEFTASIENARFEMKQLDDAGKAFTVGNNTEAAQEAMENLRVESAKLKAIGTELQASFDKLYASVNDYVGEIGNAVQYTGFLQSTLNGLKMAAHAPVSIFKALGTALKTLPINAVRASVELAKAAFEKFGMAVKTALSQVTKFIENTVTSGLKKITSGILGIHKSANKTSMSLGQMLKTGLLMSVAFRALSAAVSAMKEGFQNLAQYSGTTNGSISMLWSSLERLKNSLATAFAPILDVIAPILSRFIDMLSTAASYVSMFFSMITGKSTYTRAVAVQKDYAASLADTAGAAGDVAKATDEAAEAAERYLSPLDDINKFTSNNSESGGNGGSGGGGGGAGGTSPADMFEEVEIEPLNFDSWGEAFSAFLDYLLNTGIPALRNALFSIAAFVNEFSANLYEMFTFPGVVEKVQLLGQEVARAFNDLVNWIDWKMIGSALGAGLNLAIQFLVNLVYTFDWKNLGSSIAQMVNNMIAEIDWYSFGKLLWLKFKISIETFAGFLENLDMSQAASALSGAIRGFIDSISETLITIDWQKIGNQIAEFFTQIDYSGITDSLFFGIGAALASLAEFLWGLIEDAWNSVVDWWQETAYEDGKFTIQGLLEGIWEVMKSIGSWIKEHIFQPFIDGFKNAFGINSPSTVMAEMGECLMEGLFQGITSLVDKVVSIFEDIREKISEVWENIKVKTSEKWNEIQSNLGDIWEGLKTSVSNVFTRIKNTIGDTWNNVKDTALNVWENIKTKLTGIWNGIKSSASSIFNGIKTTINNVWSGISNFASSAWNGIRSNLSNIWNGIKNATSSIFNGIRTGINNIWSNIKSFASSVWNGIRSNLSSIWNGIKSSASSIFNGIKTTINNVWSNIKSYASSAWNGIKWTVENIWNGLKNSASNAFNGIRSIVSSVWNSIRQITSSIWNGIVGTIKSAVNGIIGGINGMIRGVVSGINSVIRALNRLSFKIPDWVPLFGGRRFGFNIGTISAPQIPYLASGAVIPPNKEFLAVLGDQKSGNNIEAPESLIRRIVREETGRERGGSYEFVAQLNRRTIFRQVIEEGKLTRVQTGKNPFELA